MKTLVTVIKYLHWLQGSRVDQEKLLRMSTTLYVGNLSFYTTEEQLYELFSKCGDIKRIVMGLDKYKKTPCGFCFVEYVMFSLLSELVFCLYQLMYLLPLAGTTLEAMLKMRCDISTLPGWTIESCEQIGMQDSSRDDSSDEAKLAVR